MVAELCVVVEHGVWLVHLLDVLEHVLLADEGGAAEGALQLHVERLDVLLQHGALAERAGAVVAPGTEKEEQVEQSGTERHLGKILHHKKPVWIDNRIMLCSPQLFLIKLKY